MADIFKALTKCLPGHRVETKLHHLWVFPPGGGEKFLLPKGAHGAGYRAEIERGHVKAMARQFNIAECLRRELPGF